jgi:hypothetical protein
MWQFLVKKMRYLTKIMRNPIITRKTLRETRRRTVMRQAKYLILLLSHHLSMSMTNHPTNPSTKRMGAGQSAGGNWKYNP